MQTCSYALQYYKVDKPLLFLERLKAFGNSYKATTIPFPASVYRFRIMVTTLMTFGAHSIRV
jgi:hypothetical protein